jgi:hypothetical protein
VYLLAHWFFLYFLKIVKFIFYNYFMGSRVNDVAGWGSGCGVWIGEASGIADMGFGCGVWICEAVGLVAIPP